MLQLLQQQLQHQLKQLLQLLLPLLVPLLPQLLLQFLWQLLRQLPLGYRGRGVCYHLQAQEAKPWGGAGRIFNLPSDCAALPGPQLVALVLNYVTAYQMMFRLAKLERGSTVLVHGIPNHTLRDGAAQTDTMEHFSAPTFQLSSPTLSMRTTSSQTI